jgi:CarD family transcriptional regulator
MTVTMVKAALKATASKRGPADSDPFHPGEAVVYPTHGVGRIKHVGTEEIAGVKLNLIHISFDDNQMTLRIPVAQARAAGLRKIATGDELADALLGLKGRPRPNRLIWAKRAQDYLARINSGDLAAVAGVVRDLQAAGDGTGSSFSQRNLFELALDRLASECAAVNGTSKTEAVEQIQRLMHTAKHEAEAVPEAAVEPAPETEVAAGG